MGFWDHPTRGISTPSAKRMQALLEAQQAGGDLPPPKHSRDAARLPSPPHPVDSFPGHAAWIEDDWKLHRIQNREGSVRLELYDLEEDPTEKENRLATEPRRMQRLRGRLETWLASVARSLNGEDYADVGAATGKQPFRCGFEDEDWWRAFGIKSAPQRCQLVARDATRGFEPYRGRALRIRVDKGGHYGASILYRFGTQTGSEPDEAWFRYRLRFARDWTPDRGGKLPGFSGTYGRAGWGGRPVSGQDGWSARGLFQGRRDGRTPVGFYCYHADMTGKYVSGWVWDADRASLANDRWYRIDQHVRLNTPGKRDGVLEALVDGHPVFKKTDIRFRDTPALKVEAVWLNVYLGGRWTASSTHHLYVDDVVISTRPSE
jgi:hypothetical protein